MAAQDVLDLAVLLQCGVQRIDGGARYTECNRNAFLLQYVDSRFGCRHFCHGDLLICMQALLLMFCML